MKRTLQKIRLRKQKGSVGEANACEYMLDLYQQSGGMLSFQKKGRFDCLCQLSLLDVTRKVFARIHHDCL